MVWAWVLVGLVFGLVFFGLGWGSARVKDFWTRFRCLPVVVLDREMEDFDLEWVKPKDGELRPDALDGGEVMGAPGANWTYNGSMRGFLVDKDTQMCFDVAEPGGGEEQVPGLRPPDTAKTLVEHAKGIAWRNYRKADLDGLSAFLQENAGLVVAMMLVLLLVLVGMVAAILFGGGG